MISIFSQPDNDNSPDMSWLDNNTARLGELPSWLLEILSEIHSACQLSLLQWL